MAIQDTFKISEEIKKDNALETFEGDIGSTLNNIADKTISRIVKKNQLMERKDKIEIVRQLEGQGFFLIKGAIKLISRTLRISKFTIYNYLEKIRSENYISNL
jgi:predicted transcriptional regulator YheO